MIAAPLRLARRGSLLAGALLVLVFAVLSVVAWRHHAHDIDPPGGGQAGPAACRRQVVIELDTDEQLRAAADTLRTDHRIAALAMESREQAEEKFSHKLQGLPALLGLGRPAEVPAVLWLAPAPGVDIDQLADQLRGQFHAARKILVQQPCGRRPRLTAQSP